MNTTDAAIGLRLYRVWDPVQRLFHWLNVGCVLALVAIGTAILWDKELGVSAEGKVLLKTVHVWFGYVFAANLAVRLGWAFVGSPFGRWRAMLPFGRGYVDSLRSYLAGSAAGDAPRYLGHNPLGRIMVAALLLLMTVQAVSGLVLAGTDIYYPPLGAWIAGWVAAAGVDPATLVPGDKTLVDATAWADMRALRKPFIQAHEVVFYLLLGAALLHIAAVVRAELREGGSLVSAMLNGRKTLDRPPVDQP
ncbi:putative Ni/Fe-hydrogenase 1 B-type cytochrome subunit [Gammaproteobacteria bacterium]|nr:cytochrome b/b6 domain-containing protein [Gammaproteobacteria bacterium]QOJ32497.1 MAG: cytochrome b/b6 domain-containing protein [Gammaproteobacteria bacterium]CAG0939715.1 putative Ni/Fe-hydrogenase 1 B-type cytochrome subunit [Gammaproteobacteria bacterium]